MIYSSAVDWQNAAQKRVVFFGMSGLGKTHISNMLRQAGDWFHYSVDYRIGTRYMGEHICDNFKSEAMKNPFLRDLLLSDSIRIDANVSFENLNPVSTYLGKPGDTSKGGLPIAEYCRRQLQFKAAENSALKDTKDFIHKAAHIYKYDNFICDTGGSICEWVDPDLGAKDDLIKTLSDQCLMVWIKGSNDHTQELIRRFDAAPKPMTYQPEFLTKCWDDYLTENKCLEGEVDPNAFIRWTYTKALAHRQPLYESMARFGVTILAEDVAKVKNPDDFIALISRALETA